MGNGAIKNTKNEDPRNQSSNTKAQTRNLKQIAKVAVAVNEKLSGARSPSLANRSSRETNPFEGKEVTVPKSSSPALSHQAESKNIDQQLSPENSSSLPHQPTFQVLDEQSDHFQAIIETGGTKRRVRNTIQNSSQVDGWDALVQDNRSLSVDSNEPSIESEFGHPRSLSQESNTPRIAKKGSNKGPKIDILPKPISVGSPVAQSKDNEAPTAATAMEAPEQGNNEEPPIAATDIEGPEQGNNEEAPIVAISIEASEQGDNAEVPVVPTVTEAPEQVEHEEAPIVAIGIEASEQGDNVEVPVVPTVTEAPEQEKHEAAPIVAIGIEAPEQGDNAEVPVVPTVLEAPEQEEHETAPIVANGSEAPEQGDTVEVPVVAIVTEAPEQVEHEKSKLLGEFFDSVSTGNEEYLASLLAENPSLVIQKDEREDDFQRNPKIIKSFTGLHYAVEIGNKSICSLLIEKGVHLDIQSNKGCTALHWAVKNSRKDLCSLLVEKGASLDIQDQEGSSALHMCVKRWRCTQGHNLMPSSSTDTFHCDGCGLDGLTGCAQALCCGVCTFNVCPTCNLKGPPEPEGESSDMKVVASLLIQAGASTDVQDNDGATVLMKSIKDNDNQLCNLLIEKGAKFDTQDNTGSTALHQAIKKADTVLCNMLIEKGINLNLQDNEGSTPLHLAIKRGNHDLCALLIEKGARVDILDKDGSKPLHLAIKRAEADICTLLIEKDSELDVQDNEGFTSLQLAVRRADKDLCKLLIEKGAQLNITNNDGSAAIHQLVIPEVELVFESSHPYADNADTVQTVGIPGASKLTISFDPQSRFEQGCDYVQILAKDSEEQYGSNFTGRDGSQNWPGCEGREALVVPRSSCRIHFHSDGSSTDWGYKMWIKGRTAFQGVLPICCGKCGHGLEEKPAGTLQNWSCNHPNHVGENCFSTNERLWGCPSISTCNWGVCLACWEKSNLPPTNEDSSNDSSLEGLENCTEVTDPDIMEIGTLLVQAGADLNLQNKAGKTALMLFAAYGWKDLCLLAMEREADVNLQDQNNATVFLEFASKGWSDACEVAIQKGATVDVQDTQGVSALMKAAANNKVDVVKQLVQAGANLNLRETAHGYTAIMLALQTADKDLCSFLLENGAQTDILDNNGTSPLHLAVQKMDKDLCTMLIDRGARLDTQDNNGSTALHLVTKCDFDFVFESSHPYADNCNTTELVMIPGAKNLILTFDPQSRTEANYDYVTILHKDSDDAYGKFTGRDGSQNWAGCEGREPLKIPGDSCRIRFVSDGSNNDWGYKLTVKGEMPASIDEQDSADDCLDDVPDTSNCEDQPCFVNNREVASLLIQAGANLDLKNKNGSTALMQAAHLHNKGVASLLIQAGAILDIRNKDSKSALMQFASNGWKDLCALAIEKDANVNLQDKNNTTALMQFALKGWEELCKLAVEKGANVNVQNKNNETALMKAAAKGHKEVCELFIGAGANVDLKDTEHGYTALMWAITQATKDVCEIIIESGAQLNIQDNNGSTALHLAVKRGDKELCQLLIDKGAQLDILDNEGSAPLHLVLVYSVARIFESSHPYIDNAHTIDLVEIPGMASLKLFFDSSSRTEQNYDYVRILHKDTDDQYGEGKYSGRDGTQNWPGCDGRSPLVVPGDSCRIEFVSDGSNTDWGFRVTVKGYPENIQAPTQTAGDDNKEVFEALIQAGANLDIQDKDGCTPLTKFASQGWQDLCVLAVEKGANVNIQDKNNETALMKFASKGWQELCSLAIAKQAVIDIQDNSHETALIKAALANHKEVVELFIKAGANLDLQNKEGCTVISMFASKGWQDLCVLALEKGASLDIQDENLETALIKAASNDEKEVAKLLIEAGANLNLQSKSGTTALMLLASKGWMELCALAIGKGANADIQDEKSETALMKAAAADQKEVAELLLNAMTNLDLQSTDGSTALMTCVSKGWQDLCILALEKGASANIQDKKNETALIKAIKLIDINLCNLLIEKGAELNIRDCEGSTSLHQAVRYANKEVCSILIEKGADVNVQNNNGSSALHLCFQSKRPGLKLWKVVMDGGALVRESPDLDSCEVTTLEQGTVVFSVPAEDKFKSHDLVQSGRRVRIIKPVIGYASAYTSDSVPILSLLEQASVKPISSAIHCPGNHALVDNVTEGGGRSCDMCRNSIPAGVRALSCRICNFDACPSCFEVSGATERTVETSGRSLNDCDDDMHPLFEPKPLTIQTDEMLTKVIASCRWNDQGWGNQKGKLFIRLLRNSNVLGTVDLFGIAPHSEESRTLEFSDTDAAFKQNIIDLQQPEDEIDVAYVVGGGGGHALTVSSFSLRAVFSSRQSSQKVLADNYVCEDVAELLIHSGANLDSQDKDGLTALMLCAQSGCKDLCALAIEKGAGIDVQDANGETALLKAAYSHSEEVAKFLINSGVSLDLISNKGTTALMQFAENGWQDLCKLAITKGANADLQDNNKDTAFVKFISEGWQDVCFLAIENGVNVNTTDRDEETALIKFASKGWQEVCELAIQKGAMVQIPDKNNETPLMKFAAHGWQNVCALAIEKGASVNSQDNNHETALMKAAANNNLEVSELLIQMGAELDLQETVHGYTALIWATKQADKAVCSLLVEKGAKLDIQDNDGSTALHQAVRRSDAELCQLLIEKGAQLDIQDNNGSTALFLVTLYEMELIFESSHPYADNSNVTQFAQIPGAPNLTVTFDPQCRTENNYDYVSFLKADSDAQYGLDKYTGRDGTQNWPGVEGRDPLVIPGDTCRIRFISDGSNNDWGYKLTIKGHPMAQSSGQMMCPKGHGALEPPVDSDNHFTGTYSCNLCGTSELAGSPDLRFCKECNFYSCPSCTEKHFHTQNLCSNNFKVASLLVEAGANLELKNKEGYTVFMQATKIADKDLCNLLIEHGVQFNIQDNEGSSPLHKAIQRGDKEFTTLLIEKGAGLDIQDSKGLSPLHLAIESKQTDICTLLMEKGAPLDMQNNEGFTPLHLAIKQGDKDLTALLIDKGAQLDIQNKEGATPLHLALGKPSVVWKVVGSGGCLVRQTPELDSPEVTTLSTGTTVKIIPVEDQYTKHPLVECGRRVRLSEPASGYASVYSADKSTILEQQQENEVTADSVLCNLLLEKGARLDIQDKEGTTALHLALKRAEKDLCSLMIEKSTNLEVRENDGSTALHLAVHRADKDLCSLIINKGAALDVQDNDGAAPLHLASVFELTFESAHNYADNSNTMQLVQIPGAANLSLTFDPRCRTENNYDYVQILKKDSDEQYGSNYSGRDGSENWPGFGGRVPLELPGDSCRIHFVSDGSNNDWGYKVTVRDSSSSTKISNQVACSDHKEIAALLIQAGANLDLRTKDGSTSLMKFSSKGWEDICELAIKKGANPDSQDQNNETALMKAASSDQKTVVAQLIAANVNLDTQNNEGSTALLKAARSNHKEVAELLINAGASIDIPNNEGFTALFEFASQGCQELCKLAIEKGANTNIQNSNKETPLMKFESNEWQELCVLAIKKGAKADIQDSNNETTLMKFVSKGWVELVRLALEMGANANIQDNENESALLKAVKKQDADMCSLLIENGAELDLQDKHGSTALHLVSVCDVELVFESPHPYPDNSNTMQLVEIPGAPNLTITFDPQCRTEQNYDYVYILKKESDENYGGKFTGRDSSENWPGFGGRDPLVVPGDSCRIQFVSDGSNNDWGYKVTVKGRPTAVQDSPKLAQEWRCAQQHLLSVPPNTNSFRCNICGEGGKVRSSQTLYCVPCDYDVCSKCKERGPATTKNPLEGIMKNLEIASLLIQAGADPSVKNEDGLTALNLAQNQDFEAMTKIIESAQIFYQVFVWRDAEAIADEDKTQKAAEWAFQCKNLPKLLQTQLNQENLAKIEAAVQTIQGEEQSVTHKTILMLAAEHSIEALVEYLVGKEIQIDRTFVNSWTALMFASFSGNLKVVQLLHSKKSDIYHKSITEETALMLASRQRYKEVVYFLSNCIDDETTKKNYVNAKSTCGRTALMEAARSGDLDIVTFLIEYGAKVEVKDTNGWDALMHASWEGRVDVVASLIERGANVNTQNEMQNTPLALAAIKGNHAIVKLLMTKNADPLLCNKYELSALMQVKTLADRADKLRLSGFSVGDEVEVFQDDGTLQPGRVLAVSRYYNVIYDSRAANEQKVPSFQVRLKENATKEWEEIKKTLSEDPRKKNVAKNQNIVQESPPVTIAKELSTLTSALEKKISNFSDIDSVSKLLRKITRAADQLQLHLDALKEQKVKDSASEDTGSNGAEEKEPGFNDTESATAPTTIGEVLHEEIVSVTISKSGLVTNALDRPVKLQELPGINTCSKLEELHIDNCPLAVEFPRACLQLNFLRKLTVAGHKFQGRIPAEIGEVLPHLVELCLSNNQLIGTIPDSIGLLQRCEIIDLSNNELTGSIPSSLGEVVSLRWLFLQHNLLSGEFPKGFGNNLHYLKRVDVGENSGLCGILPDAFLKIIGMDLNINGTGIKSGTFISLLVPQFELHVVPREVILKLVRLCTFEEAGVRCKPGEEDEVKCWKNDGLILCLKSSWDDAMRRWTSVDDSGTVITREELVFMSHRWLSSSANFKLAHPDDEQNTKLNHMKQLAIDNPGWKYFWIDFMCVPQAPHRYLEQLKAINSLPHIVKCCSTMVTLCGREGESKLEVYRGRGWCRLEQLSSITPVYCRGYYGEQFLCNTKLYIANKDEHTFKDMERLSDNDINPLKGVFFDDFDPSKPVHKRDRSRVAFALKAMCESMLDFPKLQGLAVQILASANKQIEESNAAERAEAEALAQRANVEAPEPSSRMKKKISKAVEMGQQFSNSEESKS